MLTEHAKRMQRQADEDWAKAEAEAEYIQRLYPPRPTPPALAYADYRWDHAGRGFRQRDLTVRQVYDRAYVEERYAAIDDAVWLLSARRLDVLEAFAPGRGRLLDFGCGSGRVVQQAVNRGWDAWGCDLAPGAGGRRLTAFEAVRRKWDTVTFFDSLEHVANPDGLVRALSPRVVMVSVPWCHRPDDADWFMAWKHRRPGEHLWHWGRETLDQFFARLGYRPLMHSSFEDEFRPHPDQREPNILTAVYHAPGSQSTPAATARR